MGKLTRAALNYAWKKVGKADAKRLNTLPDCEDVEVTKDCSYLPDGKDVHKLDIYRPKNNTKALPLIVDYHGGGWMYGSKELNGKYCQTLAAQGFAVADVNYTLAPEADLVCQVRDVFSSLEYLNFNAKELGFDKNNIFVTGDSAGGLLALLAAAVTNIEEWQKAYGVQPAAELKAVGITCGAVEFESIYTSKNIFVKEVCEMLFGKKNNRNAAFKHAGASDLPEGCSLPPILFVGSRKDMLFSVYERGAEILKEKGMTTETLFWDEKYNLNHVFNIAYPYLEESVVSNKAMCDFFKKLI